MAVKLCVVCKIVFSAWDSFQVGGIVAHQPLNKSLPDLRDKKRVFPESLGSPSPARVTGRFYDRRPVSKCEDYIVVKSPCFVGDHFCLAFDQLRVPGCPYGHAVRERSCRHTAVVVSSHDSVERFTPDVIMIYPEARNGGHCIAQLALFLFGGHSRNKVGGPFFK